MKRFNGGLGQENVTAANAVWDEIQHGGARGEIEHLRAEVDALARLVANISTLLVERGDAETLNIILYGLDGWDRYEEVT